MGWVCRIVVLVVAVTGCGDPGTGDGGGFQGPAAPGPDTDPGADDTVPGSDTDPGTDPVPGSDAVPGSDTDPGTDAVAGADTDTDPGTDPDPGTDTDPGMDTDPGTDPDPEPDPICPPGPYAARPFEGDSIEAVEVCSGLTFAEGPVWLAGRGSLFFSDFQIGRADLNFIGRIVEYVPRGGCTTFLDDFGSNGLGLHSDGRVLACRHDDQTVSALDPASGEIEVLVSDLDGSAFSSPNDVTMRSDGNLYFTDPAWQVGDRPELLPQRAYRRDPSGTVHVIDDIPRANGITLSPDETRLYVSDQGSVRVYDLAGDGATGTSASFVSSGSDGMAVDCAGNLYITTGGEVRVFAPDGQALGAITLPDGADGTTNVAFGGADRLTLYITGPSSLHAVGLAIPGWPF